MGLDSERLKHRGRLAEKEADARRLDMSIQGDIAAIRDLLDPFAPIEDLRAEVAASQAVELAGKHAEYCGVLAEIKAIKKALGI
ncbi:hypothetical protein [Thiovibrio frasassiensis]|uniref:Uncharacterized protein n=1 Tax=Thiovibrio frasassiensis TaxID=2984131 RepID=A0A9X4MFR1_9BACT|nr:hypothetical protein [Thiovibrio frasassiensis]MDG4475425.1 hypothetical protein [Thiovibrio frasassiensis]